MVQPEAETDALHSLKVRGVRIKRHRSGQWSVAVLLRGRITIDATRSIAVDREVTVSARQDGSKPRGANAHRGLRGRKAVRK